MENTDLVLMKSVVISDAGANGARQSFTQVTSNVLNNMFPNVTQTERTAGNTRYRKFFQRNKEGTGETAVNSRVWISQRSTGGGYYRLKVGTDTDVQTDAEGYSNFLGTGHLTQPLGADATTMEALFDNNDGVYDGSRIRLTDNSGGEEFLTIAGSGGVTWNGNTATIVVTSVVRSTYPASQNSLVSGVIDLGDLVAASSSWVETSVSGTYNESTYPLTVNNVGTIDDTWTLTFTGATTFTVVGTNTGSVGSGSTAGNFSPINTLVGTGDYYFILLAAGWGGTWTIGDTVTFTTSHSSASFWVKEITPSGTSSYTNNTVKFKIYAEGS